MISTVLAEMHGLVRPLLLLAAVATVLLGWGLVRRDAAGRRLLGVLTILAVAAALALTLVPDSSSTAGRFCTFQARTLTEAAFDVPNMMLLFPATLFGALRAGRVLPALGAAVALSLLIELTQGLLPLGRSCDTDDLISNVIGASIAAVAAAAVLRLDHARPGRGSRTAVVKKARAGAGR